MSTERLRCACPHPDRHECARIRDARIDRFDVDFIDDPCECICHEEEEEDLELAWPTNEKAGEDR